MFWVSVTNVAIAAAISPIALTYFGLLRGAPRSLSSSSPMRFLNHGDVQRFREPCALAAAF
jgi:hypothetical protein